ncbi:unnamed protein product [Coccothraustes coccothraustes]
MLLLLVLPPPRIGDGACNSRSGPSSSALREMRGEPRGEPAGGSLPGCWGAHLPGSPRTPPAAPPFRGPPGRNLSSSTFPNRGELRSSPTSESYYGTMLAENFLAKKAGPICHSLFLFLSRVKKPDSFHE